MPFAATTTALVFAASTLAAASPTGVAAGFQSGPPALSAPARPDPTNTLWTSDVVYGRAGDVELQLNLAQPPDSPEVIHPCVVIIHGGAWRAGNRAMHDELARELAARGYVAATISYRFCPQFTFPAQVEDAKCAVRFLRAHAEQYGIDAERIGAIGFSAGAHLAMMLGTLDADAGMEGDGGWAGQSSKVQAVVAFFGPTDLLAEYPAESVRLVSDFIGGSIEDKPGAYQLASPIAHVNRGDAPMMLFQGTKDNLVPWTQATSMADALSKAGVTGRVELLIGKAHGWLGPELIRTLEEGVAFFDEVLNGTAKSLP